MKVFSQVSENDVFNGSLAIVTVEHVYHYQDYTLCYTIIITLIITS